MFLYSTCIPESIFNTSATHWLCCIATTAWKTRWSNVAGNNVCISRFSSLPSFLCSSAPFPQQMCGESVQRLTLAHVIQVHSFSHSLSVYVCVCVGLLIKLLQLRSVQNMSSYWRKKNKTCWLDITKYLFVLHQTFQIFCFLPRYIFLFVFYFLIACNLDHYSIDHTLSSRFVFLNIEFSWEKKLTLFRTN